MIDQKRQPPRVRDRLVSCDILRFLAVALVLGRHAAAPSSESQWLNQLHQAWFRGGWIGVDLFFVLSGFLVGGLLIQEHHRNGRVDLARFLVRRGWKIYPAFYVMLAVTVWIRWKMVPKFSLQETLAEVFFVQNYVPGVWAHTWSLAVEEHFYFLLAVLMSWSPRWLVRTAVAICVGTPVLRCALWLKEPTFNFYSHLFATHLRMDSLMVGVLIAYGFQRHRDAWLSYCRRWRLPLLGGCLLAYSPAFLCEVSHPYFRTIGLSVLAWGSAALLSVATSIDFSQAYEVGIARQRGPSRLMLPVLSLFAFLGAQSYSIYLWHGPCLKYLLEKQMLHLWTGPLDSTQSFWIYVVGSLLVGCVMAQLVERPLLTLRNRWFPSRSGGLTLRQDEPLSDGPQSHDAAGTGFSKMNVATAKLTSFDSAIPVERH